MAIETPKKNDGLIREIHTRIFVLANSKQENPFIVLCSSGIKKGEGIRSLFLEWSRFLPHLRIDTPVAEEKEITDSQTDGLP